MSMPQQNSVKASIISSLYIEALREGQSLWFRVISNSMIPTLRVGDRVFIEPAKAKEIRVGEITAFETAEGLVIHRIVRTRKTNTTVQLLQMADVELHPSWVDEQAVVGRVTSAHRQGRQVNFHHPIAKMCGTITARSRYLLYLWKLYTPLRIVLRLCSRWVVRSSDLCIQCFCTELIGSDDTSSM